MNGTNDVLYPLLLFALVLFFLPLIRGEKNKQDNIVRSKEFEYPSKINSSCIVYANLSVSLPAENLLQRVESPEHVRVSVREQRVGQRGGGRGGQTGREGGGRTAEHGGTHPHPSTQFHQLAHARRQQQRWDHMKGAVMGRGRGTGNLVSAEGGSGGRRGGRPCRFDFSSRNISLLCPTLWFWWSFLIKPHFHTASQVQCVVNITVNTPGPLGMNPNVPDSYLSSQAETNELVSHLNCFNIVVIERMKHKTISCSEFVQHDREIWRIWRNKINSE